MKKKGCLAGCLALPVILLLAGFFLYQRARTAPQVGENFSTLSPQQKIERRASAQKLQDDVRQIARAAKNNEKKRFTLTVDEGQLNTLLQDGIDTKKFPIRDLRVGLQPNQLILQGRVAVQSFDATVTISGALTAEDGAPHYEIDSLQFEGIPAGGLRKKAQKQVNKALKKWRQKMPGRIDNVVTETGKMTVSGQTD